MQVIIEPGYISGTITPPPSKSMTQRAYAAALLHQGNTIIHNSGASADDHAMLKAIEQLGAEITFVDEHSLSITSKGIAPVTDTLDCHESGFAARMLIPIASIASQTITVTGVGSLMHRKVSFPHQLMKQLGVHIEDNKRCLPVTVRGPMTPTDIHIDGSASSQFLSGLLFAISGCASSRVKIHVKDLKSKPYVDMTLQLLAHFGKPIQHHDYKEFYIAPSEFTLEESVTVAIENDWSSAATLLVAGAIAGNITIRNMNMSSLQADKEIMTILFHLVKANIVQSGAALTVTQGRLQPFEFNATHCPDLFPVLCILAACCEGESYIYGVHRLFDKESNRIASIADMLWAFGIPFSVEDDYFCISGVNTFQSATIDSCNDHRIAMAAAVGALKASASVVITGTECVHKSYPNFFNDMELLGMGCSFSEDAYILTKPIE